MTELGHALGPAEGGCAVMLPVPCLVGWPSVMGQAADAGMTPADRDGLHVTVVFLGRDLDAERCEAAVSAVIASMTDLTALVHAALRQQARDHGLVGDTSTPPSAFVPLRFPGVIDVFKNKGASHVIATCETGPPEGALGTLRSALLRHYRHKVRADFGGWRPHVTLAEGPPGADLPRTVAIPRSIHCARSVVLKLGKVRRTFEF